MKRILSFMMLLVAALTLVACTEVEGSLEITQMPPTQFTQGYTGDVTFKFKADNDEYTVTWVGSTKSYTYEIGGKNAPESLVEANGVSVTAMDFSSTGTKTVIIKFDKLTAQFQYEVKPVEVPVGDGTAGNPFRIYTATDLITKLAAVAPAADQNYKTAKGNTVYFKLEADLDFSGKEKLELPVANISVDGSKDLGGNYKISNLRDTLFGMSYYVSLRNIDIVDAVTKAHIVGTEFFHSSLDNVNILGNSFTSEAAYFDKMWGVSSISNSKNYATVIDREGTAAGFIRRVDVKTIKVNEMVDGVEKVVTKVDLDSVVTFTNSFNYGTIQTATSKGRIGGLVAAAGSGKVVFVNSGNLGKVQMFIPQAEHGIITAETAVEKGAYSIIGNYVRLNSKNEVIKDESQYWVNHADKAKKVQMDDATKANAAANQVELINTLTGSINIAESGEITVSGASNDVVSFRVSMYAGGDNHKLENGILKDIDNGGNINIYYDVHTKEQIQSVLSLAMIKEILNNPFISALPADATVSSTDKLDNGLLVHKVLPSNVKGYDAHDRGNNRIANLDDNSVVIQVYGYNTNNELIFATSTTVKVTAPQA